MVQAPSPPYVPAKYHGGRQEVIERIVIHSAVMALYNGAAADLASYFQHPSAFVSAHYTQDNVQRRQCVWDNTVAWHDGYNLNEIGIEMCEYPNDDITRWYRGVHRALLAETAKLTRQLCLYYGIPMTKLSVAEIEAGHWGVCGHDDISDSWLSPSTHTDPGAFPWDEFMRLVRNEDDSQESRNRKDADVGALPQYLPKTKQHWFEKNKWKNLSFPVECGSSSAMVDELWFTLSSNFGDTEYALILEGPTDVYHAPVWIRDEYTLGTLAEPGIVRSGEQLSMEIPEEADTLTVHYRNASQATCSKYSFPQTIK